jgi:hypothetical protein
MCNILYHTAVYVKGFVIYYETLVVVEIILRARLGTTRRLAKSALMW